MPRQDEVARLAGSMNVQIDPWTTQITKGDQALHLGDLQVGDHVQVAYVLQNGQYLARSVFVH